ncbi:MAG: CoA ester lyase [Rhodobacteraceae bacterium]|jgi:(3S)-malyl-CoA thioesterase|nr:CoA ester lyase [Paracoccaceae bacterium]
MDTAARPWRSALYIPGSRVRALDKARQLPADAILFDLEDAVAPDEKPAARRLLAETLAAGGYGHRALIVRINALDTPWGAEDVDALADANPAAILLPKVNSAADIEALARRLDGRPGTADTRIWAMMETPLSALRAAEIAAAPRMQGFVVGTNDLAKDLGARFRPDRLPLMAALQAYLLAARAFQLVCIDGVYNAFRDTEGLRAECEQGRDLGMDGKSLIHPDQVPIANEVFAPADAEIDLARRQIAAFAEAEASGAGVAVVDGRIVENLHVAAAKATLAKAEAIATLATC